jgi:hypothetical protein
MKKLLHFVKHIDGKSIYINPDYIVAVWEVKDTGDTCWSISTVSHTHNVYSIQPLIKAGIMK